ncbi:carboxymuconolactone decarboxylase family protein [Maribacter sp. 6B07]|uniref:Alkylhydroperoxidase AhpD family core domain-containing protein n=1 Tax=Maribacter dokdonensis TaxID=320912 RepID=A0ABY0UP59_9FLAO|nr:MULTISPECIES: carboxymuconolactone decarboxylase family protein [Maribacter]PHN94171.1 carboxymuconolactone decarboxylase family protein [Maribacter sp. 6B07]SDS97849.1 alkylhydroperoxidase AhpD family core domain-containing protein [Maribacter dokdonensis]HAF76200.1 carboxymuconolactone decarboxylase family protein [Maribacter sp.]|tara:strand:+ start:121019 stop:121567 length:549 start_codon:yes stop_codon:yes gene_type:complete
MTTLKVHNIESAPEGSKPLLENSQKSFGMIPGLHGVLAASPKILEAYQTLHQLFTETSFNEEELTVVWQTINVEHACHYCVPAHTGIAKMMKVDDTITEALRNETPLADAKLEALRTMTLTIVRNRGNVTQEDLDAFYAAGYGEQQVLEIILGLSQKVISNYTNHIAHTPVDEPFKKFEWSK